MTMRYLACAWIAAVIVISSAAMRSLPSHTVPVHEVQVVAKQYTFEPSIIQVTAGEPVRLVIRSADRAHGFAIRDLKIDVRVPRGGDAVTVDFTAPPAGRYEVSCSEFCGSGHRQMTSVLVSLDATQRR